MIFLVNEVCEQTSLSNGICDDPHITPRVYSISADDITIKGTSINSNLKNWYL